MSRFLSIKHKDLAAYTPGEQPTDLKEYTKLNTNESPYPPPPDVLRAVTEQEINNLRLYPNPDGSLLIEKIAKLYNVTAKNVIIGNGSDELLAFAFHGLFHDKGVAFPDITYGFYPVYAKLYGIDAMGISLRDDFTINVDDYKNIGKNIVIANPNAPTGIALSLNEIEEILGSNPDTVVVIDEAYVDFGADSAVSLIDKYDNLIVMHTFSKSRSMAGARMAYAIASPPLIEDLNKMKYSFNPYNVNRLTQAMSLAALDNEEYFEKKRKDIIHERTQTAAVLKVLGFIMTDSKANFIFAKHPKISGLDLYTALKEKGVLVRQWNKPKISDYLRITIGSKTDMFVFNKTIKQILEEHNA